MTPSELPLSSGELEPFFFMINNQIFSSQIINNIMMPLRYFHWRHTKRLSGL